MKFHDDIVKDDEEFHKISQYEKFPRFKPIIFLSLCAIFVPTILWPENDLRAQIKLIFVHGLDSTLGYSSG